MAYKIFYEYDPNNAAYNDSMVVEGWNGHYLDETYATLSEAQTRKDELTTLAGQALVECRIDEV